MLINSKWLFLYSFFMAMSIPIFFPLIHLIYFAPFLVLCYYRDPLLKCICLALISGFVIDLFSSQTRIGTYSCIYCLVTLSLYRYKFLFFEDSLTTLPVMTFLFSALSFVFQTVLFVSFGIPVFFSYDSLKDHLILFPIQNATYAGFAFTLPSLLYYHMKRTLYLRKAMRRKHEKNSTR